MGCEVLIISDVGIAEAAKTGEIGDGKIFISAVDTVIRFRTGDRDGAAL